MMKITDEMVVAAFEILWEEGSVSSSFGQVRKALEAALSIKAKFTREQINEMIGCGEMFVDTNPEAEWITAADMACPHCGGSGHKDDVLPRSASPAGVVKPLENALCEHDWFDCSNSVVQAPTKSCRKCGWTVYGENETNGIFIEWPWLSARIMSAIEPAGVGVETPPPSSHLRVYPQKLTDDLRFILSMMMWTTGPMAQALRDGGQDIKRKAEEEQAEVMHWLIGLALEHGILWRQKASDRIREIRDALATTEGKDNG